MIGDENREMIEHKDFHLIWLGTCRILSEVVLLKERTEPQPPLFDRIVPLKVVPV